MMYCFLYLQFCNSPPPPNWKQTRFWLSISHPPTGLGVYDVTVPHPAPLWTRHQCHPVSARVVSRCLPRQCVWALWVRVNSSSLQHTSATKQTLWDNVSVGVKMENLTLVSKLCRLKSLWCFCGMMACGQVMFSQRHRCIRFMWLIECNTCQCIYI